MFDICRGWPALRQKEERISWTLPNFLWRRHVSTGKDDAVIYTVSDATLLHAIGQYRSQRQNADGSVMQIQ